MKAIVQSYGSGELAVTEVPAPALRPGGVLVRNRASLVSAGTERLMVELARKSLLGKARDRPDLVRRVLGKVRRDGLMATVETVRSRLDAPVPLGYSSAGTVIAVGEGVSGLRAGDRVACAGAGYASHAEVIFVPQNLAVAVPPEVPAEAAAFTTVGAIALEGLRLARLELGETVAVIGLGLVGLLAAQLARAAGCRVVGMDTDPERCRLAGELGVEAAASEGEELVRRCRELTAGHGADKVIVAASTKSSQPLELAAEAARERGVVSVVGAVGMELPRQGFYDKELTLAVSRSYGPGRYDPEYEEKGRDYPYAHVRWTENRNMQAFVDQLAAGRVDVAPLISHRFPIDDAERAYALLTGDGTEPYLGIVLTYPGDEDESTAAASQTMELKASKAPPAGGSKVGFGVLGAGQFAVGTLLPALARLPSAELAAVCTATGVKAEQVGRKFGFRLATTSESAVLERPEVGAVMIATRHHLHARQVIAALEAGKDVFVEKPLCLSEEELAEIEAARAEAEAKRGRPPLLMVGYNRRFAPLSRKLRDFAAGLGEPLVMGYRVNAGYIPPDHWTQDPEQGGGRILGEVCHFVDYLAFVAGAPPVRATAHTTPDAGRYRGDNLVATIELADGSVGTVTYVANGDPALPKERFELFGGGAAAVLDNFRTLELIRGGRRRVERSRLRQDKGHADQLRVFVDAAQSGGPPPIPWPEIAAVSRANFALAGSLQMKLSG